MATRSTSDDVRKVLGKDYDWERMPDLTPMIDSAAALVARVTSVALSAKSISLTAVEQELVMRWLSAHFYQAQDKGYASKSTQGASASFQGQKGQTGLETTEYGKRAILLDYSGVLDAIDKRKIAVGAWGGTTCPTPARLRQNDTAPPQ